MKPVVFTLHARGACADRNLEEALVEAAARSPGWVEPDERTPGAERRFRTFPEHGGRVLRVVCFETEVEIRVLTAFLDRNARRR